MPRQLAEGWRFAEECLVEDFMKSVVPVVGHCVVLAEHVAIVAVDLVTVAGFVAIVVPPTGRVGVTVSSGIRRGAPQAIRCAR